MNDVCECYQVLGDNESVCFGTREKEPCNCGGDCLKCDFYPEKRIDAAHNAGLCCENCKRYGDEYDEWCDNNCIFGVPASDPKYQTLPMAWEPATSSVPEAEVYHHGDMVNHPDHYNKGGIECKDALNAMVSDYPDPIIASLTWQVGKYIWRHPFKSNPTEDLNKAKFYIDETIKRWEELNK